MDLYLVSDHNAEDPVHIAKNSNLRRRPFSALRLHIFSTFEHCSSKYMHMYRLFHKSIHIPLPICIFELTQNPSYFSPQTNIHACFELAAIRHPCLLIHETAKDLKQACLLVS
jgi:hypothetical protein